MTSGFCLVAVEVLGLIIKCSDSPSLSFLLSPVSYSEGRGQVSDFPGQLPLPLSCLSLLPLLMAAAVLLLGQKRQPSALGQLFPVSQAEFSLWVTRWGHAKWMGMDKSSISTCLATCPSFYF